MSVLEILELVGGFKLDIREAIEEYRHCCWCMNILVFSYYDGEDMDAVQEEAQDAQGWQVKFGSLYCHECAPFVEYRAVG